MGGAVMEPVILSLIAAVGAVGICARQVSQIRAKLHEHEIAHAHLVGYVSAIGMVVIAHLNGQGQPEQSDGEVQS